MKRIVEITLFLALITFMASCTSKRDRDINAITQLEKQLGQEGAKPDPAKLNTLLDAYIAFVDGNAGDTAAPNYLYKAVNLSIGIGNGEKSMQLIDRTLNEFPGSNYLPETVFLKAYVYENLLSNLGQASVVYNDFIRRYPEHDLADDARAALQYLGKSPEEMVREFELRKAAEASAGAGQ